MNLPPYPRPSLTTVLAVTKAKQSVKTGLGITAVFNCFGLDEFGKAVSANRLEIGGRAGESEWSVAKA